MECKCKHDFQDSVYGKRNRVFNERKEKGKYRCTVCSADRTSSKHTVSVAADAKTDKKTGEKK